MASISTTLYEQKKAFVKLIYFINNLVDKVIIDKSDIAVFV